MIFTVGPFSFRKIYNDHYVDRSTKTKGGKSKWVDKERQRPNCAILDSVTGSCRFAFTYIFAKGWCTMVAGIDVDATAKRLDELRIERNLSIKDIQHHFNFYTPQAVYKWMNGQALPTIDNLVILADLYKCKIDDMLVRIEF